MRIGMLSSSRLLALSGLAAALIAGGQAQAAPRYMGGRGGIANASVSGNNTWERGPVRVSTIVANDSPSTDMTAAGNAFTMPVGAMALTGMNLRFFPTFVFVAQNSFSFMTTLPQAERLENGQGAAATAPINFCPPKNDPNPLNGNLNCLDWANPGDPNYRIRMGIDRRRTAGGDPIGGAFGGTLRLARNVTSSNVWFAKPPYLALGNLTGMQRVSKQPNSAVDIWTPGRTNFAFGTNINAKGPQYSAMLGTQGQIASLTAGPFPATGVNDPVDRGWGFKMTTGVISGSDQSPALGGGIPFFSFATTGDDTVTAGGQVRNIVLVGGGIALSGASGSLFERLQILDVVMAVPEPATLAGLGMGFAALLAFARVRRA
jgi:PEP-CTERM motif